MSRSSKKGPFIDPKLLKKVLKQKQVNGRGSIKTWSRACVISPDFVGQVFSVHRVRNLSKFPLLRQWSVIDWVNLLQLEPSAVTVKLSSAPWLRPKDYYVNNR
jgi:hypothetical protein